MLTRTRIAAALLPLVVLAGCSSGGEETTTAAGDEQTTAAAADCAPFDGETITADSAEGEPTLEVPKLEGWQPNDSLNSELIRLVLANPDYATDNFAPNLVVTAEPSPADPQAAFEAQRTTLEQQMGDIDITSEEGQVCGHDSMLLEFTLPAMGTVPERPGQAQIIVVPHEGESITYVLTSQALADAGPGYREDLETITAGVRVTE